MSCVKIMHAEIRMLKYTCSVNDNSIKQASSLKNFIRVRVLFYAYSKIRVFGKSRLIVIVIPITFFKTTIEKRTPFKRCNTKSIEQTSKITQALLKADKKNYQLHPNATTLLSHPLLHFYSPNCLGQKTATGSLGLRVILPPAYQSTTHGKGFTLKFLVNSSRLGKCF